MIAYIRQTSRYGTIFATKDEWALVQNSLRSSYENYEEPCLGWAATFTVGFLKKKYHGLGWNVPTAALDFVIRDRNVVQAKSYSRL